MTIPFVKQRPVWSKPYYGVSHARINGRQVTVEATGGYAKGVRFPTLGTPMYLNSAEERDFFGADAAEQARKWCEEIA